MLVGGWELGGGEKAAYTNWRCTGAAARARGAIIFDFYTTRPMDSVCVAV
jgi:hypothetical protein